jgi:hypothetical protein
VNLEDLIQEKSKNLTTNDTNLLGENKNCYNTISSLITVGEYRKMLNDYASSDDQIIKRLNYLEGFLRKRIRDGLKEYVKSKKNYN